MFPTLLSQTEHSVQGWAKGTVHMAELAALPAEEKVRRSFIGKTVSLGTRLIVSMSQETKSWGYTTKNLFSSQELKVLGKFASESTDNRNTMKGKKFWRIRLRCIALGSGGVTHAIRKIRTDWKDITAQGFSQNMILIGRNNGDHSR